MALLQCKNDYSVGIAAVDHEHRELINLINRLHDKLVTKDEKSSIEDFLGDLFKGISAHFALEERFMRDYRYDQFTEHKRDHETLLDDIRDIMDAFEDSDDAANVELGARLDAWFSRHFETHDARLHKALGTHPR